MKIFIILLSLISFDALACRNKAPLSAIKLYISSTEGVAGVTCEERPEDQCLCFDHIESWSSSKLIDVMDNNPERPIYSEKYDIESCEIKKEENDNAKDGEETQVELTQEENCQKLLEVKECKDGEKYIAKDYSEVYCTKLLGYEQMKVGEKLVVDEVKLAQVQAAQVVKEQEIRTKKEQKEAKKNLLKSADVSKISTVKDLKELVKNLIEVMED